MPDLSNLLGAVYGDTPSSSPRDAEDEAHVEREPAADERGPAIPDWADDEHLDAAFAQWKPGPSDDAPPVERAFVKDADPDDPAPPLADDLAAALSEALVAVSGTAADSADTTVGHQPPQRFDFAVDEDHDDPTEEAEPPQAFAVFSPVAEPEHLSKPEVEPDEHAETELPHELGEVAVEEHAAEPEPEPEVSEPEPVAAAEHFEHDPADADADADTQPPQSAMPHREAAAELTAASRVDSEFAPLTATPAPAPVVEPEPLPAPVVSAPTGPMPGDGAAAPTTLPAGMHRWDRSSDDILPDKKPGKGFFSFSLRRG
jgi:hypothetical protein